MSLQKRTIRDGDQTTYPQQNDNVTVQYTGWMYDSRKADDCCKGRKFDSSIDKGRPFQYRLGLHSVIKGWEQALPQMSLGEKALWTIPSDLAYGASGFPGLIPPHSTLIFEMELKGINNKTA